MPAVRARQPLQRRSALRGGSLPIALALVVLTALASPARAQIGGADRAYDEGRFAEAGRAYEDALATGALDPSGLAHVHLRLGVIAALGGDAALVDRHFVIALAIDPALEAPAELDPARRARFEAMRGERVRVHAERTGIVIEGAPAELALSIEARGEGWNRRFPWEGTRITIAPPASALPIDVRLVDPHGNGVARGRIEAPRVIEPPRTDSGEEIIESPWLWVAIGVILLGVGLAIGFSASGERFVLGAPVIR
jgi:hypothetical protein